MKYFLKTSLFTILVLFLFQIKTLFSQEKDVIKKIIIDPNSNKRLLIPSIENEDKKIKLIPPKSITDAESKKEDLKKAQFKGKGKLNCLISAKIFELLIKNNIPTHFLELKNENTMIAHKIKVIPLEIVLRNTAYGSLCKETTINFSLLFFSLFSSLSFFRLFSTSLSYLVDREMG